MNLRKCTATKGGVIHLAYPDNSMSLCGQYVGEKQESINKEPTCKKCIKLIKSGNLPPNIKITLKGGGR